MVEISNAEERVQSHAARLCIAQLAAHIGTRHHAVRADPGDCRDVFSGARDGVFLRPAFRSSQSRVSSAKVKQQDNPERGASLPRLGVG